MLVSLVHTGVKSDVDKFSTKTMPNFQHKDKTPKIENLKQLQNKFLEVNFLKNILTSK